MMHGHNDEHACSKKRPIKPEIIKGDKLEDVVGQSDAIDTINKTINLIRYSALAEYYDVELPKGYLFYGPPGVGKTMMARAVCNETDSFFLSVPNTSIGSKYINQSSSNLSSVFEQALLMISEFVDYEAGERDIPKYDKIFLFFDEMDGLFTKRQGTDNSKEDDKLVNTLCQYLDGFSTSNGIYVIGATNYFESIKNFFLFDDEKIGEFKVFNQETIAYIK